MFPSVKGPGRPESQDGEGLRVGIVHARWNSFIVDALIEGARSKLLTAGVKDRNIHEYSVPGSWELPLFCSKISRTGIDVVIAIGVLIKGDTMHFEYIANAVSEGLMRVQLDSGIPVVFGLLTVLDEDQARARAGLTGCRNHGEDWGLAAVELGVKLNASEYS